MINEDVIDTLELAEEQLKVLLESTPATIVIGDKNDQDLISDALEEVQFSIRCLLKLGKQAVQPVTTPQWRTTRVFPDPWIATGNTVTHNGPPIVMTDYLAEDDTQATARIFDLEEE